MNKEIFVFGSNLAGIHGAGAAKHALQNHGARWKIGHGIWGNSYALPTKDQFIQTLPLDVIKIYVDTFIEFARAHPEMTFKVTRIGCGLAGYRDCEIAPMFFEAPLNCQFDLKWAKYLPIHSYWGTM